MINQELTKRFAKEDNYSLQISEVFLEIWIFCH